MLVIKLEYLVLCKRTGFLQTEQLYNLFVPWLPLEVLSVGMRGCNVDCSASVEQTKLIHLQAENLEVHYVYSLKAKIIFN